MIVEKELLKIGRHKTKNGELIASEEWADERVKQYKAMRQKGIKSPVFWGHNSKAYPEPLDQAKRIDEHNFATSKYRAGDVVDLFRRGDRLRVKMDVPGIKRIEEGKLIYDVELPDGRKVEGAISEVSGGFQNWQDGAGELHPDALIHVALCSLPVSMDQEGFENGEKSEGKGPILLSTSTWLCEARPNCHTETRKRELATGQAMPDETKPEADEQTEPKLETPKDKAKETEEENHESGDKITTNTILEKCSEVFKFGLPEKLPQDPYKALELIYQAACAIKAPETEGDLEVAKQPNTTSGGPILLSTMTEGPSALLAKNLEKRTRQGYLARIDSLKNRGLTEEYHKKLSAMVPALELSLNPESGEVLETNLDTYLDILEKNLPSKTELSTETELEEVKSPTPDKPGEKTDEQIYNEIEQNTGIPSPLQKAK